MLTKGTPCVVASHVSPNLHRKRAPAARQLADKNYRYETLDERYIVMGGVSFIVPRQGARRDTRGWVQKRPAMRRLFEPVALKMYAACAGVPTSNPGCGAEIWTFRDTASRRAGTIIAPHPFLYAWQSAVSSKKTQKLAPVFSVNVTMS